MSLKVVVTGIAGRMGAEIARCVVEEEGMELFGGVEQSGHPSIGQELSGLLGYKNGGPTVRDNLADAVAGADVVIDFTVPSATFSHFNTAADAGVAIVIGTTGFSREQTEAMRSRSGDVRCVMAPNMSVGVNMMFKLAADAASVLGSAYDMEIVEIHHNRKKDAPSGTAARLAEICAQSTGRDLGKVGVYGREGIVGERKPEEIAVMSLRAGDVVGEHTLIFGGPGERLEITHKAASRKNFALGSVRAAKWIVGHEPGIYDMQDVLSLR